MLFEDYWLHFLDALVAPSFLAGIRHIQISHSISDSGEIAGYGLVNGQTTAMILSPVPKPNAAAMLLAGLIGLACRMRRLRMVVASVS